MMTEEKTPNVFEMRELDRPDDVARLVISYNDGADGIEYTLPTVVVDAIVRGHKAIAEAKAALLDDAIEALEKMQGLTLDIIARETTIPRAQLTAPDVLLWCSAGAASVLDRIRTVQEAAG